MDKISVYLVDDHQIILDGLKALLGHDKVIEIAGESTRCKDAFEMISICKPDVILTDIHMPDMNGIEFSRLVKKNFPEIKIIALSMSADESLISDMLDAGASGYLVKNTGKEELREALIRVVSGEVYFSPEVAAQLSKSLLNSRKKEEDTSVKLTQREVEIVRLIAKEYSNEQIANGLFISERTVETHRKNIFRKTKIKGVIGLLKYAMENKLLD
jgi:two-component system, NarL family, nitrate/nitrite response regulator NarL